MRQLGIAIIVKEDFEERLRWATEAGFTEGQLQIWNMEYLCEEHANRVKYLIEEYDFTVNGLWCGWHGPIQWDFAEGPSILGLVPADFRASRMKNLLDGAAYARVLGVKDIVTHLGFVPLNCRDINYTQLVSSLNYLTDELKKFNQNFLMETGQEPPVVLKRLIEDVRNDNLFVNYDPANLMMYGNSNPVDGLEILKDYIKSIHAKDGEYPQDGYHLGKERPIGKGDVDFPRFIRRLKELEYDGPISIEHEIEVENEEQKKEILEGKAYLDNLL